MTTQIALSEALANETESLQTLQKVATAIGAVNADILPDLLLDLLDRMDAATAQYRRDRVARQDATRTAYILSRR
jgi:hypothetical protein